MNTNQQNELLTHISLYADYEDFEKKSFMDSEELEEKLEEGFIQELTRGVYNGASNTFTPNTLNTGEIIEALIAYISETDFISMVADSYIDADEIEVFEDYTPADVLEDFLNMYDVFTIGNNIYADIS